MGVGEADQGVGRKCGPASLFFFFLFSVVCSKVNKSVRELARWTVRAMQETDKEQNPGCPAAPDKAQERRKSLVGNATEARGSVQIGETTKKPREEKRRERKGREESE